MDEFDYIIVGAGSAGCVLAERLSADRKNRVLLIEAGGSDKNIWIRVPLGYARTYYNRRLNWCYQTGPLAGLNGRSSYWPRGKVVGGSSSINAMVYFRGLPEDFQDWSSAVGPEWQWSRVRPVFEELEQFVDSQGGTRGEGPQWIVDPGNDYHPIKSAFLDAAATIGLPSNPAMIDGEGVGRYCITARHGVRCSAASAFLYPSLKRLNLTLLKNTLVERILIREGKADGLVIQRGKQKTTVRCRREVILCAGAVNSPHLLQVSGLGPGDLLSRYGIKLEQDLPMVGCNLQDHLAVSYAFTCRQPTLNNQLYPWWGRVYAGARYLFTRRGPLALGVNQCGGLVRSGEFIDHADMQLYFNPITYSKVRQPGQAILKTDSFAGFSLSFQPCRPTSRGSIRIRSADIATAPDINPAYLSTDKDLQDVILGGRLCSQLLATAAMSNLIVANKTPHPGELSDQQLAEDFRARADTVYHPVGTCAMGKNAKNSVVDRSFRIHGVARLRVVDASVFPNITSGNTNAPTLMVAHRAAEKILSE